MIKLSYEDIRAIAISQVLTEHGINPDNLLMTYSAEHGWGPVKHQALAKEICQRIDELQKDNRA